MQVWVGIRPWSHRVERPSRLTHIPPAAPLLDHVLRDGELLAFFLQHALDGWHADSHTRQSVLFLALFVLNVCTHGTTLGLISTGGLALLMGYLAYRAWFGTRQINQQ